MRFYPMPKNFTVYKGTFNFEKKVYLNLPRRFYDKNQIKLLRELFKNFTAGITKLKVNLLEEDCDGAAITVQKEQKIAPEALEDYEYKVRVTPEMVLLSFADLPSMSHAFCSVLSLIEVRSTSSAAPLMIIPECQIQDKPSLNFRAVHICVFTENSYNLIRKCIRLVGFSKYTHLILEFWGTFKYKCNKYLSRKDALSHAKVRKLVKEANALGVEVIPMLNMLGHAAQNRAIYGKHTALDRNPKLQPYYEKDGWTFTINNPQTKELLRQMRKELMEVCGKGKYFHGGCDEAFTYGSDHSYFGLDKTKVLYEYLNEVSAELQSEGRRLMIWGDQLLYNESWKAPSVIAYGESKQIAETLLENLDKNIIIADWQYYSTDEVMPTPQYLREKGFDVIIAPFDNTRGQELAVKNVQEYGYYGYMQTTWHLLSKDLRIILQGGERCWEGYRTLEKIDTEFLLFEAGSYLRRLLPPKNYKDSGISAEELET